MKYWIAIIAWFWRRADVLVMWRYSELRKAAKHGYTFGLAIEQMRRRRAIGYDPAKNLEDFEADYQEWISKTDAINNLGVEEIRLAQEARWVVAEMEKIQSWGCDDLTKQLFELQRAVYRLNKQEQIATRGHNPYITITALNY